MYRIQASDLSKASRLLAQTFANYPIFVYIIPDGADRIDRLGHLFDFMLRMAFQQGEVLAPSSAIEGVSVWLHSAQSNGGTANAMRAGLVKLCCRIGARPLMRFIKVGNLKKRKRSEILPEPHYCLDMLAVDAAMQRAGFGRSMVDTKLRDLDHVNAPCYLETSDPGNVAYYERFGFRLIHQYRIAIVDIFCLLRRGQA